MRKVMVFAQVPPPMHGASMMNLAALNALKGGHEVGVVHVQISASRSISDMQKGPLRRALRAVGTVAGACRTALFEKTEVSYINASPAGLSSVRDLLLVVLRLLSRHSVHAQFHGCVEEGSIYLNSFVASLLRGRCHFIFLSRSLVSERFFSLYPASSISLLGNFAPDEAVYLSDSDVIQRASRERLRVCFLANMLPAKGVVDFLEICARALRSGHTFEAVIAGAWTEKFEWEDYEGWLATNGDVAANFNHLGGVDAVQKHQLLRSSEILVYPSWRDAAPLVVLEAMANRVAVIASDVGAISEMLADSSLLVQPRDIDAFVSALRRLLSDRALLSRKQSELREAYECRFSHARYEEQLRAILGLSK